MAKIRLSGHINVVPAELDAVTEALVEHIEATRQEPGCLVFEVTADAEVPGRFSVYEEFVDQAAFDHHQARAGSSPWAAVTVNVDRHYTVEEVES